MLTELEKRVVACLQGDIPLCSRPYGVIAEKLGITEDELIQTIRNLHDRGVIRRFGATLRHQKSGFSANAMVAWRVDECRVDETGKTFAEYTEVTHCYRREPVDGWPFNLYTMVHAETEEQMLAIIARMKETAGAGDPEILFSRRELKKTSMVYFPQGCE